MERKRYGVFCKLNDVYLGSQLSSKALKVEDMGFTEEEAYIAVIEEGQDFCSCKYDQKKKCLVSIEPDECNKLLNDFAKDYDNHKEENAK